MSAGSVNPCTGEEIDTGDIDQLLRGLAEAKQMLTGLYHHIDELSVAVLAISPADRESTTRLRGSTQVAIISPPEVAWDGKQLQQILSDARWKELAAEVLYVREIGVKAVAWKKMAGSSGAAEFNLFRDAMQAACKGRVGKPKIRVESA